MEEFREDRGIEFIEECRAEEDGKECCDGFPELEIQEDTPEIAESERRVRQIKRDADEKVAPGGREQSVE